MNTLPISQLRVWPGNPRKTINAAALDELTTSISDQGLLQPVVVRALATPIEEVTHEVIDGQRRYLASQRAQLAELPVVVRDIDDTLALEIALAANTARVEPEPIEEAEALEALVKSGRSPIKIAERLGRSAHWVAQRRKLLGLNAESRVFVREKALSFAHMVALAVVDASIQKEIVTLYASTSHFPPAWQFAQQIHYRLRRLENAPFDITDATLGGEGACTKCVYRSDTQGDLFGNTADDAACLRSECWNSKVETNWQRAEKDAKKRKLKVVRGNENEGFDQKVYTDDVPQDSGLQPIAITRSRAGRVIELYDVDAAGAAWDALSEAQEKRSSSSSEEHGPTSKRSTKSRNDDYVADRAKRRAKSAERLKRLAKLLEEVDGLERLALALTQDELFEVSVEAFEAAGISPVLGREEIEAHQAPTVFILSCLWDKIRDEEYSDGEEIEQWIAKVLGEETSKEDLFAKLTASIEASKSARDLGDAWQCIASIDREVDNVSEEQIVTLTNAWKAKAESIGLSDATLKKMAAEGKGPAIEKREKRAKKSKTKTAEATP